MTGAVIAENREEAEKKAIELASEYKIIKDMGYKLSLYTLIEITDEKPGQFCIEHRSQW